MSAATFALAGGPADLRQLSLPLALDRMLPGDGPWEVEIGFGKGRYLLRRAAEEPGTRFLGVEIARKYWRLVAERARRRGLANLVAVRAEAEQLLAAVLPHGFARRVHVYFPDPWPKSKHHRRRLFDPTSVDLVLGLLAPGGTLCFATDFLDYGDEVEVLLRRHPDVEVSRLEAWPEGPRTNYEAKYEREGRPIRRLEARRRGVSLGVHPDGRAGLACAYRTEAGEAA
jgi:tRNA (guanine-N7-)-methyltransferase